MSSNEDQQYIQELYKTYMYSGSQFDKQVLFIASGAFGLSFAFIDKLIPKISCAADKHYLIYSWSIFACVIFISLINHFISMYSIGWRIKNPNDDKNPILQKLNYWIRTLNILMILGLLTGSSLLIIFININL